MAAIVEWPDVVAEVADFLRPRLLPTWPSVEVGAQQPGTSDLDTPHEPFVQVSLDDPAEVFPIMRDNLVRFTVYGPDRDTCRDVAEAVRGELLALAYSVHPVLRVVPGENGTAPIDAKDQISGRPMSSALVRIQTRPIG